MLLGGAGSGPAFCDFADRLLARFGSMSSAKNSDVLYYVVRDLGPTATTTS